MAGEPEGILARHTSGNGIAITGNRPLGNFGDRHDVTSETEASMTKRIKIDIARAKAIRPSAPKRPGLKRPGEGMNLQLSQLVAHFGRAQARALLPELRLD
jgi:hypothetical protein